MDRAGTGSPSRLGGQGPNLAAFGDLEHREFVSVILPIRLSVLAIREGQVQRLGVFKRLLLASAN